MGICVVRPTTNFQIKYDTHKAYNIYTVLCAVKFIAMKYSKEEIEKRLKDMLHEMLRGYHQEDSILSLEYDEEKQECNLKMNVHIVEDDDYVGFGVY